MTDQVNIELPNSRTRYVCGGMAWGEVILRLVQE
jgi:hypothetical protein